MYTQVKLPPLIPPCKGGKQENLVPSPMHRGGLGWGKTDDKNQVSKLFQTCVYTVALKKGEQES